MSNLKGYVDEDNFIHDIEYEVIIHFANKWNTKKIKNFINENLIGVKLLEVKNSTVKLLWPLEAFSGEEEIIEEMYYILDENKLGTYEYARVN